jgi:hypothetical protein
LGLAVKVILLGAGNELKDVCVVEGGSGSRCNN